MLFHPESETTELEIGLVRNMPLYGETPPLKLYSFRGRNLKHFRHAEVNMHIYVRRGSNSRSRIEGVGERDMAEFLDG